MNPYAAPGATPAAPQATAEDDIAAATPPLVAKVAGGLVAFAGAIVGLTGVQTLMIVDLRGAFAAAPWALALLGLAHVFVGAAVFRARAWAAMVALGGMVLLMLLTAAWLVFSIAHGLVSLYALGSPVAATAAFVLAILALGPCRRATAARTRLRDQGMNLGI